ncbi:hypothetical protein [Dyadobacter fermentans]|uniref:hypothetical protein n=1 Tax=Dyadobacter fermentans TaxID=94254 RepID=UPI0016515998|nr:hypothetical protein [Dyadobacter fermentans]
MTEDKPCEQNPEEWMVDQFHFEASGSGKVPCKILGKDKDVLPLKAGNRRGFHVRFPES